MHDDIRKKARERVKTHCRVCPICDGKACAGEVPGMGGVGTGSAFKNNIEALLKHRLVMRVLHDADEPDTSRELWGRRLSLPVLAAPIGSVKMNLGSDMEEDEYIDLVVSGCVQAGTMASIGDTPWTGPYQQNLSRISGKGRNVIPFIKPWDAEEVAKRMDMALEAGCDVCGMDVDAAGLGAPGKPAWRIRPARSLPAYIKEAHARKMKFIVKGVMDAAEARMAAEAGADAVLVSNHGGRVLDHTPGTAEALPAVAEAVGKRTLVMLDGGIRSGEDVLKAMALGARFVLICRPVAIAAHGGGAEGVARYFQDIRDNLYRAMRLTGCNDLDAAGPRILC